MVEILEIVDIPDGVVDGDDVIVLYATPSRLKDGTCRVDAIPVDYYTPKTKKVIDLSRDVSYFEDEVQVVDSIIKRPSPRRVFKGESSNSKSAEESGHSGIPSTFMCEICADEKPTSGLFRVLGCDHSYCNECITSYVAAKLQENITAINCPVPGCAGFLQPYHCRPILPKQVFDRWGDVLCEAMILASEKLYCPFKDCSALLINDDGGNNGLLVQSECPYCNRLFCAQCQMPWHSGITCDEIKKLGKGERGKEDIMLVNLAKSEKWMRCSKCKFYVERTQGCSVMACRCGHTFCYHCGNSLKDHYCKHCKR